VLGVENAIRLSALDNVAVAIDDIEPGDTLKVGELSLRASERVPLGHKVALVPITSGDKIVKLGMPIGSAISDIAIGEHVHMHNVRSDYLNNVEYHWE
jgi:altronate hydrolase